LVGWVSEAERYPADVFDDAVVPFAAGVGQAGVDGGDDRVLRAVDGRGQGVDLGDLAGSDECGLFRLDGGMAVAGV